MKPNQYPGVTPGGGWGEGKGFMHAVLFLTYSNPLSLDSNLVYAQTEEDGQGIVRD